jgi:hypothetical protein
LGDASAGDIPLMRAGLLLMAVIAAVGGFSLVVLPDQGKDGKDGDRKGDKDRDRVAAVTPASPAAARDTAVPPAFAAVADTADGFACRRDASGIQLASVHESSGLALSATGDALWTHNDSGRPVLYRVGFDGRLLGQVTVTGATVEDWEDIAAAPCPGGGRCLYVGDIGDNKPSRASITIYRVPEPAAGARQTEGAVAFTASYPDGPQDAEALFVLQDGSVYIVTKGETGPIAVYQLPRDARQGTVARLQPRARLSSDEMKDKADRITGAAASPDGQWLALRTVDRVSFYRLGNLATGNLGEPFIQNLRELQEPQGEAVEFGRDGVIHLSSEGGQRETPATLARLTCTLPG